MREAAGRPSGTLTVLLYLAALTGCEKPTDSAKEVTPSTTVDRKQFSFDYPARWVLESDDSGAKDKVTIDAGVGAMIVVQCFDLEDEASRRLPEMIKKQEATQKELSKADVKQWGPFTGIGAELRYKAGGVVPTTLRLFAFHEGGRSFFITELMPDDRVSELAAGFKTIQDSFKVKE
jgi:hypothetical protein